LNGCQFAQVAKATNFSFAFALAHASGVNRLICVILAAGKRAMLVPVPDYWTKKSKKRKTASKR
jgi:hypothetical protein